MRKAGYSLDDMTKFAYGKKESVRSGLRSGGSVRDELIKRGSKVDYLVWGHRVATLSKGKVAVSSAGYSSKLTKDRLNKVLSPIGKSISQKKYSWYLNTGKGQVPFKDWMSFKLR